jgi:hypothetical protein
MAQVGLLHSRAWALTFLCAACGPSAGPFETEAFETRSTGGDEVILAEGSSLKMDASPSLAAPFEDVDAYREALTRAKAFRESWRGSLDPKERNALRFLRESEAIDDKLGNPQAALSDQRATLLLADRSVHLFLFRFAPERDWEAAYAMRAGDLTLAASIVRDVVSRFSEQPREQVDQADLPAEKLKAEALAADALLRLARLGVEGADFSNAELLFRACLDYEADLDLRAEAEADYAALLELLDRAEEGRDLGVR